jgi:serine/threonine protein kinase
MGQLPEPIVHRDIKLEHVLVEVWEPHNIHLKLADFGLSNEGQLLQTFCGTLWYLALEGHTEQINQIYGPLVDI